MLLLILVTIILSVFSSVHPSARLTDCPSASPSNPHPVRQPVHQPIHPPVGLSIRRHFCLPVLPSASPAICWPFCSLDWSFRLPVLPSASPSVRHLFRSPALSSAASSIPGPSIWRLFHLLVFQCPPSNHKIGCNKFINVCQTEKHRLGF